MCGIAGIIAHNRQLAAREKITEMTDAIAHRGMDGEGCWINDSGNCGLGHRRLAIIDLSDSAAQPMHFSEAGQDADQPPLYSITYNGEIYNYIELRQTLQSKGYHFYTQSDTEVILAAYDYWKEACLQRFDGMFAFAIWNNHHKKIFAARDRFGEKPFYFYQDNQQFIFASEMKAIWATGIQSAYDEKMLLNYLTLGHVQNPNNKRQTFFKNIHALPPAHSLTISLSDFKVHLHSYWQLNKEDINKIAEKDALEKFNALLKQSVLLRLRSDVAIGSSLSGGLDSSAIVANIQQLKNRKNRLQTFSAVFPGFEKDESAYIQSITKKFQLQNYQVTPTAAGFINDFETLCYHQEEPFTSSSIYAQYKVFELAKTHQVKVLLDGQGADEILGGYHKYLHWYLQQLIGSYKFAKAFREIKMLKQKSIPFKWSLKNYYAACFPAHASIHLEKNEYRRSVQHPDIDTDFMEALRGREWEGIYKPIITRLNDILDFNTNTMGLDELLRYADRNSMAHGREVRLPFLSHELVEFIFSLPAHFKINEGWTKWLLRISLNKKLPDNIVWRSEKVGFETPQADWMQNKTMQEYIREAKRKLVDHRILNPLVLDKKIMPLKVHDTNNFDWRYLCAAQII